MQEKKTHNSLQSLWDTLELPPSGGRGKKKVTSSMQGGVPEGCRLVLSPFLPYNADLTILKWDHILSMEFPFIIH